MLDMLPAGRPRFEHLRSLLSRLRRHLTPPSDPPAAPTASSASTTPEAPPSEPLDAPATREWYLERLRRHCCGPGHRANARLCARLLQVMTLILLSLKFTQNSSKITRLFLRPFVHFSADSNDNNFVG